MGARKFNTAAQVFLVATLFTAALAGNLKLAHAQTATDLVCSQCVQTSDIALGAVTNSKLATNAVNTSKIANAAVNTAKLANNAANGAKIANNAVNAAKIADGAVTAAKLAGNSINAAKLADGAIVSGKLATNAVNSVKLADGAVQTAKLTDGAVTGAKLNIANTFFVEAAGPADTDNCTALLAALGGIVGPATVLLGPGTYNCGANQISVGSEVALVGSGRNTTTILGSTSSLDGVISITGNNATVRDLTVINSLATSDVVAINIGMEEAPENPVQNWRLSGLHVVATGAISSNLGIVVTTDECDGGKVSDVIAETMGAVEGIGLSFGCDVGQITVSNSIASGEGGMTNGLGMRARANVVVKSSFLSGTAKAAEFSTGSFTGRLIATEIDGALTTSGMTVRCVSVYDGAGAALPDGELGVDGCAF